MEEDKPGQVCSLALRIQVKKKMKDLDSGPLYSHVMLETGTD